MNHDNVMRRLRAARPAATSTVDHDALFAAIVSEPADARIVDASHGRSPQIVRRPTRRWMRGRPRVLAGSSLGLAGVGATLVLALGGSTAPPAFAITTTTDGTVLVKLNQTSALVQINAKLASMGIHKEIGIAMAPGPASAAGPVTCTPAPGVSNVTGPPVEVLDGTNGTEIITSTPDNTGAGTWHLASCGEYPAGTSLGTLRAYTGTTGAG